MGKKRIQTSNGWKKKSGNRTEDRAGYHLQYIVHSREEVWCLLFVEANCGCIVLKFQFFSVFSRFGMLHTFYHQEKKLYKEMQSFNIFPLDLFIENLIGFFLPSGCLSCKHENYTSQCFSEWQCDTQYWQKCIWKENTDFSLRWLDRFKVSYKTGGQMSAWISRNSPWKCRSPYTLSFCNFIKGVVLWKNVDAHGLK